MKNRLSMKRRFTCGGSHSPPMPIKRTRKNACKMRGSRALNPFEPDATQEALNRLHQSKNLVNCAHSLFLNCPSKAEAPNSFCSFQVMESAPRGSSADRTL